MHHALSRLSPDIWHVWANGVQTHLYCGYRDMCARPTAPTARSHTYEVVLRQQLQEQQRQARAAAAAAAADGSGAGAEGDEEMEGVQQQVVNVPLGTHVFKPQVGDEVVMPACMRAVTPQFGHARGCSYTST